MNMMDMNSVIDRMAAIKAEKKALDAEYDQLQAWLQTDTEAMLTDTKLKSFHHTTSEGNTAAVTITDTVSVVVSELLEPIFGKAYPSMVKEEVKYTLKAPAKKILAAIWHKEYCEGSVEEIISSLNCDDKAKKALLKKCKGVNWDKDKEHLMYFAGLSEQDAADTAYLIAEAAAYESIAAIIKVNNDGEINDEIMKDIITKINAAVNVSRAMKTEITAAEGTDDCDE